MTDPENIFINAKGQFDGMIRPHPEFGVGDLTHYVLADLLKEAMEALEPFADKVVMPTIDPRGIDAANVAGRANNNEYRNAYATLKKLRNKLCPTP